MNEAELIKCYMELGLTKEQARHIINAMETEIDEDEEESEGYMSDKIKLIIEIPKDEYKDVKDHEQMIRYYPTIDLIRILNGKPLSDVLNEIKEEIKNRSYGIANDSVMQGEIYERHAVLEIIDKYMKSEE